MQLNDYIDRLVARSLGQSCLVRPRIPSIFEDQNFYAGSVGDNSSVPMRSPNALQQMKTAEDPMQQYESNEHLPDSKTHHRNSQKRRDLSEQRDDLSHHLSDAASPSMYSKSMAMRAAPSKPITIGPIPQKSAYSDTISPESISPGSNSPESISAGSNSPESIYSGSISPEYVSSAPISQDSISSGSISPETTSAPPVHAVLESAGPEQSDIGLRTKIANPQFREPDKAQARKNDADMVLDRGRAVFPSDNGSFGEMADPSHTGKAAAQEKLNMGIGRTYIKSAHVGGNEDIASRELSDLLVQSLSVQSQLAEAFRLSMQPANKPRRESDVEANIQVTIGRVEVRAVPEHATAARQRPAPNVSSGLEEYLKKPKRGGR
jgi:hypothetical protein